MISNAIKEKFIELRAQGMTFAAIAIELKVSKPTLIEWSKEFEHEVANLRAIELEALQEKYYIQKQKRIELFGKQLQAIKTELSTRDLKQVPTEKLFSLLEKFTKSLREEETPMQFVREGSVIPEMKRVVEEWPA